MTPRRRRLVKLYRVMHEMTEPECARCLRPHSCCSPEYCLSAKEVAKEWGAVLVETGHPQLPFMGPTGCTVEPHLRPLCTAHTCEIGSLGMKRGDQAWTERYFRIRQIIDALELSIRYAPLQIRG